MRKKISHFVLLLILALQISSGITIHAALPAQDQRIEITTAEAGEAREMAFMFSERFLKARDLTSVARDLYLQDFIERYLKFQTKRTSRESLTYFDISGVPALSFKTALLSYPKDEHWRRLYIAANNFIYYGFISAIGVKGLTNVDQLKSSDLYPRNVAELLSRNPTLANFIEKKSTPVEVGTLNELRDVTTTLEKANAMMLEYLNKELPLNTTRIDESIASDRKNPDSVRLAVDIMDEEFFDLPKGTRIIRTDSPAGFQLLLVKTGGQMRVLWANVETGG